MKVVSVFLIAATVISQVAEISAKLPTLPKTFELCGLKDDECLLRSAQKAVKIIKDGIPKLGMFPVDPLQVSGMSINQGGGGSLAVQLNFQNQLLGGVSNATLSYAKGEFTNTTYHMILHAYMPLVTLNGDYDISGKVLILPIQGVGKNLISLENMDSIIDIRGHVIQKGGEDFIEVDKLTLGLPKITRLKINLSNLFNGDKALGDNMNKFLDENWSPVWDEIRSSFEEALGNVFEEVSKRIYNNVPYKNIHNLS